jgi:hypothetical protein
MKQRVKETKQVNKNVYFTTILQERYQIFKIRFRIVDAMKNLRHLQLTIKDYFLPVVVFQRLRNPCMLSLAKQVLLTKQYKELTDISTDTDGFSCSSELEFPHTASVAAKKLLPFLSTYLRKIPFSRYAATKLKYRNRFGAEYTRIQLSKCT